MNNDISLQSLAVSAFRPLRYSFGQVFSNVLFTIFWIGSLLVVLGGVGGECVSLIVIFRGTATPFERSVAFWSTTGLAIATGIVISIKLLMLYGQQFYVSSIQPTWIMACAFWRTLTRRSG